MHFMLHQAVNSSLALSSSNSFKTTLSGGRSKQSLDGEEPRKEAQAPSRPGDLRPGKPSALKSEAVSRWVSGLSGLPSLWISHSVMA